MEEVNRDLAALVGGKNASLGELMRAGLPVPPGFAVTTEAYRAFLEERGLAVRLHRALSDLNPDDVSAVEERSLEVRHWICQAPPPRWLREAVGTSYAQLGATVRAADPPVAVRSSATAEDTETASFAGQQDTYLWVVGEDWVVRRVQECWTSLFSPRAIIYRARRGIPHTQVAMSVGVQQMVDARAAGVCFTLDPVTGDPSRVVVEAAWGLGEAVVAGEVTPDRYVVDKVTFEVTERTISRKTVMCSWQPGVGTVHRPVPEELQDRPVLSSEELRALVQLARRVERWYGRPMDIEWAVANQVPQPGRVFLLQARPETVWHPRQVPRLGGKSGLQLLMEWGQRA